MNDNRNKRGYFSHILEVNQRIGNRNKHSIKIPVELCEYVLRQKLLPSFKVYILLKMTCSGKCRLSTRDRRIYSDFCGYQSIRSLNNHLRILQSIDWIGYNKKSRYYFIRSFAFIQKKLELTKSRTGFWFYIQDMQDFDGVIYGAVIGYLSKHQGIMQRTDRKKGRSNHALCKSPGFYPIASRAVAKILNISVSTASNMKRRAEEVGAVEVKRKRIVLPATHVVYKRLQGQYGVEIQVPIRWKGMFYRRFPDLIRSNLKYGKRKKIDQ